MLLAVLLTGCSPHQAYIEADRATYDVIALPYMDYVQADVTLTADQVARRQRVIASWLVRLEQAEAVSR